ncbi:hypothetical protein ACQP2F_18910 [Actinoplanes sp. CA-030573]|uniref:hypothetical protein n=1 Tax=Actinoplanes sp. CA-030573 TaxID=3239898 RepID=UPI003D8DFE6C
MTTPGSAGSGTDHWFWQYAVVVVLLLGFAGLAAYLMWVADGTDAAWQRRVYVFGAVEAVVFTAVGWLFGKEVHRAEAASARQDAAIAKDDAEAARTEAKEAAAVAAAAERKAVEEETKGHAVQAAVYSATSSDGEGPGEVAFGGGAAGVNLRALVDRLYGPPSR